MTDIDTFVIVGGVVCNCYLCVMVFVIVKKKRIRAIITPARWCSDNAAMVAGLGLALLERGHGLRGDAMLTADIHVTQRSGPTGP